MDSVHNVRICSRLTSCLRYCKMELEGGNKNKTTFQSYHGLHKIDEDLLWLKNTPSAFQREVDLILLTLKQKPVLAKYDIEYLSALEIIREYLKPCRNSFQWIVVSWDVA